MATVRVERVKKDYARQPGAVAEVSLTIEDNEFFVLLGPSGCGKSTLLKLIAGLEDPTDGAIFLDDRLVNYVDPGERNVAMVFQNYALYPHMTVRKNVAFPLKMGKVKRSVADPEVELALERLGLTQLQDRLVSELSGGQRQRVALARALVRRPSVTLMDEPLSNLDALLRLQTREQLLELHKSVKGTVVYVTHDQTEAMTLGDRIGVMNGGHLVQVGTPLEVYARPVDTFVAGFLGGPPMNFAEAELSAGVLKVTGVRDVLSIPREAMVDATAPLPEGPVTVGIRPERLRVSPTADALADGWRLSLIEDLGAERILTLVHADGGRIRARAPYGVALQEDVTVDVGFEAFHLFDAEGRAFAHCAADERAPAAVPAPTVAGG